MPSRQVLVVPRPSANERQSPPASCCNKNGDECTASGSNESRVRIETLDLPCDIAYRHSWLSSLAEVPGIKKYAPADSGVDE